MKEKGISPIIAAVFLIAFVLATAGILSEWFMGFSRQQAKEAVSKGKEEVACSYSGLEIRKARYNNTTGRVTLHVENTGAEKLSNFKTAVIYRNGTASGHKMDKYNTTLKEGAIKVFQNQGSISGNIDKLSIYSEDCPSESRVWLECKYIDGC